MKRRTNSSATFMLASAWTLARGRHVRIDILANRIAPHRVQNSGLLFCLAPMMLAILIFSIPYVAESWSILEGSQEVSGLPGKFLLKSLIPIFALLMLLAGFNTLRKT